MNIVFSLAVRGRISFTYLPDICADLNHVTARKNWTSCAPSCRRSWTISRRSGVIVQSPYVLHSYTLYEYNIRTALRPLR